CCLGALITRVGDLVAAADAHSAAPAEEMPLFSLEHGRIGISRAGQHPALAERPERLRERRPVERGWRHACRADPLVLTDHTVNARRRAAECPASAWRPEWPHSLLRPDAGRYQAWAPWSDLPGWPKRLLSTRGRADRRARAAVRRGA